MLPFRGWMFPDVPQTARLHYVRGVGDMPQAGAADAVALDGEDEFGGEGYLFRKGHLSGPKLRHRVLAFGVGVIGWRRTLRLERTFGNAEIADLIGAGGLDAVGTGVDGAPLTAEQLGGDRPVHLGDLTISAASNGVRLLVDGLGVARSSQYNQPIVIPSMLARNDVVKIENTLAGNNDVYITAQEQDPRAADHVAVDVGSVLVDQAGNALGDDYAKLAAGWMDIRRPQLLEVGDRPELRPVAPGLGLSELEDSRGLGVLVSQANEGIITKGARVVAEMAVAVWPEG